MRVITKETDYAIRAMVHLAGKGGAMATSAEISAEERIPLQFLRRILGRLLQAGLVKSREGVSGGVALIARPDRIRVLDIIQIFQGDLVISECMFRKRICANRGTCVLRRHIQDIERSMADKFASISIAGLLRESRGKGAGGGKSADRRKRAGGRRPPSARRTG